MYSIVYSIDEELFSLLYMFYVYSRERTGMNIEFVSRDVSKLLRYSYFRRFRFFLVLALCMAHATDRIARCPSLMVFLWSGQSCA